MGLSGEAGFGGGDICIPLLWSRYDCRSQSWVIATEKMAVNGVLARRGNVSMPCSGTL